MFVPYLDGPDIDGRDAVDAWSALIGGLGGVFPSDFLDEIGRELVPFDPRAPDTLILSILGRIDEPRAADLLRACASHDDYLVRYHAVHGLSWREDEASIRVVNDHVQDPNALVRLEAIHSLARRDRPGARQRLVEMVADDAIPPLLKARARAALTALG